MSNVYKSMGVDAFKSSIKFFEGLIVKSFPYAFTNVLKLKDGRCVSLHVDGAGSKPIIAYLAYKEFGDSRFFEGLAQDVLAMNLDDIVTVGIRPLLFVDYIALNPFKLERDVVIKSIGLGFNKTLDLLLKISMFSNAFSPIFIGGETADMPDQLRTIDVAGAVYGECDCNMIIDGSNIVDGDVILGLSSFGRAKYESNVNSGIMCNGLTLARHILLNSYYGSKYPETFDYENKFSYLGPYKLDSYVDELDSTIMDALSSPTRIYTPIIAEALHKYGCFIHGMAHITGGGLSKILKVGFNVDYIINSLPDPPPIFKLIQRIGKIDLREMYSVFNMGIGFVMIVDVEVVDEIIKLCENYGVETFRLGEIKRNSDGVNRLIVKCRNIKFEFSRVV
ncbi:MAG: AIR synthase-related protein [Candidatus Methanomethylicia archaeon]